MTNLITKSGKVNSNYSRNDGAKLKNDDPDTYKAVLAFSKGVSEYHIAGKIKPVTMVIRIRWYLDNKISNCKTCGVVSHPDNKFCSRKCASDNPETQQKRSDSRRESGEWFKHKPNWGIATELGRKKAVSTRKDNDSFRTGGVKAKQTIMERYGKDVALENSKKTIKSVYGVDNPFQIDSVRASISERQKFKASSRNHINDNLYNDEWLLSSLKEHGRDYVMDTCNCSISLMRVREVEVGYIVAKKTAAEVEILNFLSEHNIECLSNTRTIIKPMEIDVYIPSKKLAIEFDGMYWHSADSRENARYITDNVIKKERLCNEAGISLLRINEDEWTSNKKLWKSMILSKIDRSSFTKIPARKCVVVEVPVKDANAFLSVNHLQGKAKAKNALGLRFGGELVAVATFGAPRFDNDADLELIRFASKAFTSVQGGFSKLLKHVSYERLVSYANKRWSHGGVYEANFTRKSETKFSYFWISGNIKLSRYQTQKHKLSKLLEDFNPELTAEQNMFNHGFRKFVTSGNITYIASK